MNKKHILILAAVAVVGMIAGAAYGDKVPLVDTIASNLPKTRVAKPTASA